MTGGLYGSRSALWVSDSSTASYCTGALPGIFCPDRESTRLANFLIVLFVGPQGSDMTNVGIGECEHDDQGIYVLSQCG